MKNLHFPLRATFFALPLEEESKEHFQSVQNKLEPYERMLRFQNPKSPHLTLMYWPSIMEIEYHQIVKQTEKIAAKTAPFSLKVTGVDTFGDRGEDRVLFLTVAFSDELARLKKMCPWPNIKPFEPHATIARIRHPQRFRVKKKEIMKLLRDVSFEILVDRLRLYAEIDGVKQTPLQDFVFSK